MRVKLRILAFQKAVADTGGRGGLLTPSRFFVTTNRS